MYNVLRVLKKELLQLRRDKRIFPILFFAPVLQLFFLGYAATLDIKHIPLLVWDQDRSAESRSLVAHVTGTLYFDLVGQVQSYGAIEDRMQQGKAVIALVIPPGFGRDLGAGRRARIQSLIDGSDSNQALIASNYLSIIASQRSAAILVQNLGRNALTSTAAGVTLPPGVESIASHQKLIVGPEPRVWYNPELRSVNFMVPGVVVMILLVETMMLTALAVVREKEMGTMEQVIVTPIKPWQFILGKLVPFIIIGFIEVTIVLLVAVFWFKVPFRGSVLSLYGYTALFLLTTLGFGLFLSTISSNQQQAMMTAFFVMFTMIQLSGFMFPIENMPRPVQVLTYAIPMRYFLVIVRNLFLKGSGFGVLWPQALGLLIIGLAVITLSVKRFSKTLD
ncbi:MAG TPA: ABC transporter permease [bacterium]|nr:ABC transporter permease [bacterium]